MKEIKATLKPGGNSKLLDKLGHLLILGKLQSKSKQSSILIYMHF